MYEERSLHEFRIVTDRYLVGSYNVEELKEITRGTFRRRKEVGWHLHGYTMGVLDSVVFHAERYDTIPEAEREMKRLEKRRRKEEAWRGGVVVKSAEDPDYSKAIKKLNREFPGVTA